MAMPEKKHTSGFPACISLSIKFNRHAIYYETVEQWLASLPSGEPDWVSPEERQRAIDGNSVWECQWYPDTPVGSYSVAASSFETLMAFVNASQESK